MKKTAVTVIAAALLLAPVAQAQDVDWTGGKPLKPGTQVPFDPGYATQWRSYDVVKFGDRNYYNQNVSGVRVIGQYAPDTMMCLMNAKGGQWGCYVDGEKVTELGYTPGGKVVTVDPVAKFFAPVLTFLIKARMDLQSLPYRLGSSV